MKIKVYSMNFVKNKKSNYNADFSSGSPKHCQSLSASPRTSPIVMPTHYSPQTIRFGENEMKNNSTNFP